MQRLCWCCVWGLLTLSAAAPLWADHFVIRTEGGKQERDGRVVKKWDDDIFLVQLPNCRFELLTDIVEHTPGAGPELLEAKEIGEELQREFGTDRFLFHVDKPHLVGLVLAAPLGKTEGRKTGAFLKQTVKFFKTAETAFTGWIKQMDLELPPLVGTQVFILFESDDDLFEFGKKYAGWDKHYVGAFLQEQNWSISSISHCLEYALPASLTVEQQLYNRGMWQRYSDIPSWLSVGFPAGFEVSRFSNSPTRVHADMVRLARRNKDAAWDDILTDDSFFARSIYRDEYDGMAWELNWLMSTRHRDEYGTYLQLMRDRAVMDEYTPEQRRADFAKAFGKPVGDFQKELEASLADAIRKQKIEIDESPRHRDLTEALAHIEVDSPPRLQGQPAEIVGRLTNISPVRAMVYYVVAYGDSGMYADWYVDRLDVGKSEPLPARTLSKLMEAAPGGDWNTYRVKVYSTPTTSETAKEWKAGRFRKLKFGEMDEDKAEAEADE